MKPYEIKCLIIIIIISILYLFLHCSKKETFENLDSFIKNTNNGKWNFSSYNPYSDLHNFSDDFYIIFDSSTDLSEKTYNERLKYNEDNLKLMNQNSTTRTLIESILNKYNNSTNNVSIQNTEFTKFGLRFNYRVLLINAFDKLNYVKNKAKLKNLINTSLIKDIKLYYINKYIENVSISNQYDADDNIEVELKYKLKSSSVNFSGYNIDYIIYILNEIKKYLKMDIINNGTSDNIDANNTFSFKFKIIAYKLDENEKQVVNDNIEKLYNNLFTEVLNKNNNKNNNNDILIKLNLPSNETYIRDICIWKSGLCKKSTNVKIMPNCSVPSGDKNILNRYTISYNDTGSSYKILDNQKNLNGWKNHIINGIMGNNNSNTYNCNIYDINYNINGNQLFTLDLYDKTNHKKTKPEIFNKTLPWDANRHYSDTTVDPTYVERKMTIEDTPSEEYNIKLSNPSVVDNNMEIILRTNILTGDDNAGKTYTVMKDPSNPAKIKLISIIDKSKVDGDIKKIEANFVVTYRHVFKSKFNVNVPTLTQSCPQGTVTTTRTNVDNYMENLKNIKGLNVSTQNNVKAILLAEQTLEDFNNYKRRKSKKEVMELHRLRLFGKVFKLLDEYKLIDRIDSSILTKLNNMEETKNDITKNKLVAVLHLIIDRHLKDKNEEFKLNELLLSEDNTTTKKRYQIIKEKIPETNESKSLKLIYMSTVEKVNYFDKKSNRIDEELTMIEKMTNEELASYFKEINELFTDKDVNYRLKRIIDSNKNNIVRIHKKLNSLSGGLVKKMKGGSIVPNGSYSGSVGIGTTLLLNEYRDLSLSYVTSNINDLAYYNGYIYVVGNSGYFSKYNLKTNNNGIGESVKINGNKFTNLNSILANETGIYVIGDKATILYSSDKINFRYIRLKKYDSTATSKISYPQNDLQEIYMKGVDIYIIGKKIRCKTTTTKIQESDSNTQFTRFNILSTPTENYSNIFPYINTTGAPPTPIICCLKKTGTDYTIVNLNEVNDTTVTPDPFDKDKFKNKQDSSTDKNIEKVYMKNNGTNNILVFNYKEGNPTTLNKIYIYKLNITGSSSSKVVELIENGTQIIDNEEEINSVYVDNSSTGILTNKLNYYQYQQKNPSTIVDIDLSVARVGNFTSSKIVHINENTNDYTNIYHFGNAGKIFYYNINNKHETGLSLEFQKSGRTESITPNLTGIDRKGNNIYVVNSDATNFTVRYTKLPPFSQTPIPHTDLNDTILQLSGNTNIHKVDNTSVPNINRENITLLKFGYTLTKDDKYNKEDNTKLYSVKNTKNMPLDITNIQLISKEIKIEVDRNKERNKNEFVSMAILINGKFKIWLKPNEKNDIYEFNYTFSKLDKEDKYELVKYRNGIFMNKYTLNVADIHSTKISNILYKNDNMRFDKSIKTLYLDTIITSDTYNLTIIPESNNAAIIYNKTKFTSLINNIEISVNKTQNTIDVGVMNGNLYENHKIIINYKELKKITELKDYESQYLLDLLIDEAFEYLNNVNNTDRTLKFLLKKYRLNKKDEVQEFLGLFTDKNKREMIEHKFVNKLNDTERIDYIKNYLNKDKPVKKVKIEEKKPVEKVDTAMNDLKIKLDKMKIEKEILANQFKIEQRNRLFEKGEGIVSKTDITKMDTRIKNISNMIEESKSNKSKSFIDKILGFFSLEEEKKEDENIENKLKQIEEAKIKKSLEESDKKIKELEEKNKLKLENLEKKLREDNLEKINKLKEETNQKLKEQEEAKKENELLAAKEKNELQFNKNELELEKNKLEEDKIKNEMNNLFDIQNKLLKKQKSLLKIVHSSDKKLIEDIIETNMIVEKDNKITKEKIIKKKTEEKVKSKKNEEKINIDNIDNLDSEEELDAEEKLIEKSIMKDINLEIKNEKIKKNEMKKKKEKKPCVSFMDCYFKNLDDNFYTSYKNDYTFIKNAELPKEKNPVCKPKKDCEICYLNTNGVPESINYNPNNKNTMEDMPKNMSIIGNDNVSFNVNFSNKNAINTDNEYFKNNYEDLPDCPFDPCMSCENNNKYKSFNNAFNNNLIEKYKIKK